MRLLIATFTMLAIVSISYSAEPPDYTGMKKDIDDLKVRVARLENKVDSLLPQYTGRSSTLPVTCPNCSACGENCKCFGGGYYCADGKCSPTNPLIMSPVGVQQSQPKQYMQVCDGNKCRWVEVPQNQTTYSTVPQTFSTAPNFASFGDTGFSATYGDSSNDGFVGATRTGPIRSFFQRIRGNRGSRFGAGGGCSSCGN